MPSPVSRSQRVTEVRALPCAELCCLGGHRYYAPLRLPLRCLGLRARLIPRRASAAVDLASGRRRVSPVDRPAFAACRPLYAGGVPGCSRCPARTAAFALSSRARLPRPLRVRTFDAAGFTCVTACSFASPRFGARVSPDAGGWLPGPSGGLPGRDLHPLVGRPLTRRADPCSI